MIKHTFRTEPYQGARALEAGYHSVLSDKFQCRDVLVKTDSKSLDDGTVYWTQIDLQNESAFGD